MCRTPMRKRTLQRGSSNGRRCLPVSSSFWLVIIVILMLITAILTAAYNDDKTKGL